MTDTHDRPGHLVEILPAETSLSASETSRLVQTNDLEVIRLIVPAGQDVPTHEIQGEIVVHCVVGRVSIRAMEVIQELRANQLLRYKTNEPISVQGIENAVLLVTIVRRRSGEHAELIG